MQQILKNQKLKKSLYTLVSLAITLFAITWILQGTSLPKVWIHLQAVEWQWLIFGWLSYLTSYMVRAYRWQRLFPDLKQAGSFKIRFLAIFISFGVNAILPAYLGEFVRAYLMSRLAKTPQVLTIGTIIVERLLDVFVVLIFLFISLLFTIELQTKFVNTLLILFVLVAVSVWILLLISIYNSKYLVYFVDKFIHKLRLIKYREKILTNLYHFLNGLSVLKSRQNTIISLLITVIIWGLNAVTYWTGLLAFKIAKPNFLGSMLTQSVTALAITIPASPGYLGTFEAGIRISLESYGISSDVILAYAIVMRFIMSISISFISLLIVFKLNLLPLNIIFLQKQKSND